MIILFIHIMNKGDNDDLIFALMIYDNNNVFISFFLCNFS